MRYVHQQLNINRARRNEVELDVTPLSTSLARQDGALGYNTTESRTEAFEGLENTIGSSFTFSKAISASHMDPFFFYPIAMGLRERQLHDHRE
jgi:hypothetical protein